MYRQIKVMYIIPKSHILWHLATYLQLIVDSNSNMYKIVLVYTLSIFVLWELRLMKQATQRNHRAYKNFVFRGFYMDMFCDL